MPRWRRPGVTTGRRSPITHARPAGWTRWSPRRAKGASSYLRSGATYQALRLAELALHEGEADAELLELATLASWSVGLLATAVERAEQWRADATERSDDHSLARALRLLARLRWESENPEAHRQAVDEALEVAQRLAPGEDRAWIANLAAEASMLVGDTAAAVGWADEAMAAAGPDPSVSLRAAVLVNKGSTLLDIAGEEDLGVEMLQEGLAASIQAEDHQSTLRALNNLVHYVLPIWDPESTTVLLDQMCEVIGRTGRQDWWDNWVELKAIFLAHVKGDLAAARATVSVHQSVRGRRWMALVDGELSFEAGDLDRAERLLSSARAAPRSGPAGATDRGFALGLAARVAARRRDEVAVTDLLTQLAGIINGLPPNRRSAFSDAWHGALSAACRGGIDLERIDEIERLPTEPPVPLGHQGDPGWPDHFRGAKAELAGDLERAIEHYAIATTATTKRRSVPAQADALLGLARVRLLAGDHSGARESAERAAALLERWPGWRRDEIRALVRRLAAAGPSSRDGDLTPRGTRGRRSGRRGP